LGVSKIGKAWNSDGENRFVNRKDLKQKKEHGNFVEIKGVSQQLIHLPNTL
jgi:hypothetical protein